VLHYQPIKSFSPRSTVAMEALLRWAHPTRGMLGPDKFLPMAEEKGTILALGRWALRTACAQCVEWQQAFPRSQPLAVSVNLSGRQIADPGFPDDVRQILKETGLAPGSLILEINEGVLVHSDSGGTPRMWKLKAQGVRIAIDDFGTGYSSLAYLQRFPADILKVDRAFTEQLKHEVAATPLSTAVFALGQTLGLQTVAEGVETEAQWARLKELGCELGQGYLISPPLDALGATAVLRAETAPAPPMRMPPLPQWRHRRPTAEGMAGVHFA
jgi:EAL domain-containing protein (putative c-di-GMP-specific phosphodiesterase class I)